MHKIEKEAIIKIGLTLEEVKTIEAMAYNFESSASIKNGDSIAGISDGFAFYSFYFWKEVAKCFDWEPLTLALWYFNRKRPKEKLSIWKEFSETCQPEKGQTIVFNKGNGKAVVCKWYNDIYISTVSRNGKFYKNYKWASLKELEKL